MGLFKKKKKEEFDFGETVSSAKKGGIPDLRLPKLPELPSENRGYPKYNAEDLGVIKKEVEKPMIRPRKKIVAPMGMPKIGLPKIVKPIVSVGVGRPVERVEGDKPIFVKIEAYKDAIESIEAIKGLCKEADGVLGELSKIRAEEDRELAKWHNDIDKIKNKLLVVDKKLFEL
ncbi:hypothetical protein HOA59_00160 [archaeon]|jgi:hypothetical protein|nr:hypothetical protein [archaeon]MBT6823836.1 hypothetical protein [archaeon]MBT7107129.1 hypothetical protein [archaeon]MBT7297239.1 hypothetical protein [archaeon]